MIEELPPIRLVGGAHLRDGQLVDVPLALAGGRIAADAARELDISGHIVLPGIVDPRSSAWRGHLTAPRPSATEINAAITEAGRALLRNGITTAWISAGWMRADALATAVLAEAVAAAVPEMAKATGLTARPRLEADTHLTDMTDRMAALVSRGDLAHLAMMPLTSLLKDMPAAETGTLSTWSGTRNTHHRHLSKALDEAQAVQAAVPRHLCRLAEACDRARIGFSSLYDRDAEAREFYRMIGAQMADAPRSRAAASSARAMGDPVLIEARDAIGPTRQQAWIGDGLVDALVSGDVPSAPLRAVLALEARGIMPLETGWHLISEMPARIMGYRDRGRIAEGMRADLVILDAATRHVVATIAGGRLLSGQGALADRLTQAATGALAAE